MKIVVAGTGFSSILCINYLVNLGLKPVVLDVGNEIGEEEKIVLKKKALARQKNLMPLGHLLDRVDNIYLAKYHLMVSNIPASTLNFGS